MATSEERQAPVVLNHVDITIEPTKGAQIRYVAGELVALAARLGRPMRLTFNGSNMVALSDDTAEGVLTRYWGHVQADGDRAR